MNHVTDKLKRPRQVLDIYTMSTQVSSNKTNRLQDGLRGRGGSQRHRGRRGGNIRRGGGSSAVTSNDKTTKNPADQDREENKINREADYMPTDALIAAPIEDDGDDDVCWICAEPVKYWSVSECNHRTCHVCGLRLRALYKRTDCTFCKVRLQSSEDGARLDIFSSSLSPCL